ncbi:MAG: family 78 glycoside hydrolase catalytic domain [Marinilabiliaceae bacterium]|jgi:alpha-L-rhamnosidase|nr:family 78 glycoside hydrolase catalytic domain [Marinilabiliaceae bacterium]
MRIPIIIISAVLLAGCLRQDKTSGMVDNVFADALWITDSTDLPDKDSMFYADYPAPLFRKEFRIDSPVEEARLYITAAGYYLASLNGQDVGEVVLDPDWTDFSKRIYFREYDLSNLITGGENCIGVTLGNGFYNPLPLRMWGHLNLRQKLTVGKPAFIARLVIKYTDGKEEEIVTDSTWKSAPGPLMKNSVYLGTVYDARMELKNWNKKAFDDDSWSRAVVAGSPGGKLIKAIAPPVKIVSEIQPEKIYLSTPGRWIVDMGKNFTGTYHIKLSGQRGDTINFRFGERIYDDGSLNPMTAVAGQIKRKGLGGPGAPDIAWQSDSYIIGDSTERYFTPGFTYHTYRYMEISGLRYKPDIHDVKGLFIHSDVDNRNTFSCSSPLLNSIQEATERTFLSNLVSVQSDCPAREKFGYGGDLNATAESFIYNFDMHDFYRKTVYDWIDAINDSAFVDTAPFVGINYCGISWESAFLLTQYYLYLYYNDVKIVEELYEFNKKWMEKVAAIHPDLLVDSGLSDHESLKPVPVELTGTCHYLQCARVMAEFASLMDDKEYEQRYKELALKLTELLRSEFWDKPVKGDINRQTLFSALLYHDIIPADQLGAARDSLLKAIDAAEAGHFITGIFGTKYILDALSEYSPVMVYDIVNSTDYPGWGHMIDRGATTIWETWKESDNTFSNCHPMFGSVSEWFYRWLAGIRPNPEYPGFSRFTIAPATPANLQYVNCTYTSPFGPIGSDWERISKDEYTYYIKIPPGTSADIVLDVKDSQFVIIEKTDGDEQSNITRNSERGNFTLAEGDYTVRVSLKEN